ncbi:uncharacterized protein DS421_18g624360 [Arachis hypogaea]|nr:uncharacterized protein DS421_18g624360 [Arachis hypogaea]
MPLRNVVDEGGEDCLVGKAQRKEAVLGFNEKEERVGNTASMTSQSSKLGRIRSPAKELVHNVCDFFRWADLEAGGAHQDSEITRSRKKITTLKTRLKDVEWKLRIVATLGIVGWIEFLYLLLHNPHKLRQPYGMHLNCR